MSRGPALARVGAAALAVLPSAAQAEDPIAVAGRISDADFYRLVSCAAPPGGDCIRPALRWRVDRPIRVALRQIDPAYVGRRKYRAEAALTRALQELNAAGAGFRLARVGAGDPAEIEVFFLGLAAGAIIAGTGIGWVDGSEIGEISTRLAVAPGAETIDRAAIAVSTSLETSAYEAAILKALTGAMGLTTEVEGPAYDGLSALARGEHGVTRLGPPDIAALRRHYAASAR